MRLPSRLSRSVHGFRRERRGNVAVIFALSIVPLIFAFGSAADYGYAVKIRAKMNAAADAAALSAVAPIIMLQSTGVAQTAAQNLFNAQVSTIDRLTYDSVNNPVVTVTDTIVNNQRVRTVKVSYTAATQNVFAQVMSLNAIQIGGSSTATASTSPNIDFYLMLDTSPSMAIPATQAGIDYMVSVTPYQDGGNGCAFACHELNPSAESGGASWKSPQFGNPGCPDDPKRRAGPCLDNYTLAKQASPNPIPLRIDLVNQAVVNLVDTASSTALATGAAYQIAAYTFDQNVANPVPLQLPTAATKVQAAAGINMLVVTSENSNNGDQNTVFDGSSGGFTVVSSAMQKAYKGAGAGNGTNTVGDHPQQVLMLVTDGVADEPNQTGSRIYTPAGYNTNMSSLQNSTCTSIKANSNVRIAVLYLVYNPLPLNGGNSWYAQKVSPVQSSIAPALQNCASPGLFYQVNTGGDISAAMTSLFQSAVKSAHLTN